MLKSRDSRIVLSILAAAFFGDFCFANQAYAGPEKPIDYSLVSQIRLGNTEGEIRKVLGGPSRIFRETFSSQTTWEFVRGLVGQGEQYRLTLIFSGGEKKVESIIYYPKFPDRIRTVDGLKKEFSKSVFKRSKSSYCGTHVKAEEFEYDLESGLRFETDPDGSVGRIVIYKPTPKEQRKTASEPDGCPARSSGPREYIEIFDSDAK